MNGRASQSIGFSWRYRPEREGQIRFSAARIDIEGTTYETQPVTIDVVPQSQRPQRRPRSIFSPFSLFDDPEPAQPTDISEQDIFIEAAPSAREAYLNEQVTINYDLYFKSGLSPRNSRLADSWDAEGFWREDLEVTDRAVPTTAVRDGTRYNVITLKRVAVFPTRSGDLAVIRLGLRPKSSLHLTIHSIVLCFRSGIHPLSARQRPSRSRQSRCPPMHPPDLLVR